MSFPQSISSVESSDPTTVQIVNALIVDFDIETNATIITLPHDLQSARKIANKIAMIHNGNIILIGPKVGTNIPHNNFVQQFIHAQIERSPENKEQAYLQE